MIEHLHLCWKTSPVFYPLVQVPIGIIFLPFSVQIATQVASGLYKEKMVVQASNT